MEAKTLVTVNDHKFNFIDYYLYFMVLTSSFLVIQVRGHEFLMLLQIGFTILLMAYYRRVIFIKSILVNAVFLSRLLTLASACISNVKSSYTNTAVYLTWVAVPLYFSVAYLAEYLKDHPRKWELIRNALKIMCLVQMVWCLMQFVLYRFAGIDLNQTVFVDGLHLLDEASFYKDDVFMPSGLCWHPIIMAPILVLAYFLFDNVFIKIFALIEALFIGNSTVLIVVAFCVFLDIAKGVFKSLKKGRSRILIIAAVIGVLVLIVALAAFTDIFDTVFEKLGYVLSRITGESNDLSTEAHIRYYTAYPAVVDMSSIGQIFFGYGIGCSGYPYSYIFSQYTDLGNWAVETDIMNILVSRGIIGFLLYYAVLVRIFIQGLKRDYRYSFFILAVILAGITYNVQFTWVTFVEMLLIVSLEQNISFFTGKRTAGSFV